VYIQRFEVSFELAPKRLHGVVATNCVKRNTANKLYTVRLYVLRGVNCINKTETETTKTELKELGETQHDVRARPLYVNDKQMVKNVVTEKSSDVEDCVVSVKCTKSSLVKYRVNGKRVHERTCKKRVRFSDQNSDVDRVPAWRRFVRFFNFLWNCTRSVGTVLSK
jgi:hypothetical protein